jgi:RNA polymerase-binding transcription factor DksA
MRPSHQGKSFQEIARRTLVALQLGETGRAQLLLLQQALQRLDDGTWGWCVTCGGAIDEARLRAAPHASCCAACSSHHA